MSMMFCRAHTVGCVHTGSHAVSLKEHNVDVDGGISHQKAAKFKFEMRHKDVFGLAGRGAEEMKVTVFLNSENHTNTTRGL